jgi:hypothetical protein
MKKLVLITLGLVLSFNSFSQKLVVTLDTIKEINWPLNTALSEAFSLDLVEYNKGYSGYTTYTFDLDIQKLTMVNFNGLTKIYKIIKFEENNVGYYIEISHNKYTTKFIVTKEDETKSALFCVFDFEEGDTSAEGYYSNKVDVTYHK